MRDTDLQFDRELEQASQALACPDGAVGVVALVSGRAACADVLDRPATLREYWPRLVRSYRLEAMGAHESKPSKGSAQRLLRRPLEATRTAFPSPGLGVDVRVQGNGVVGAALVCEGTVIHTALFRSTRQQRQDGPLGRPSQRAFWHARRGWFSVPGEG